MSLSSLSSPSTLVSVPSSAVLLSRIWLIDDIIAMVLSFTNGRDRLLVLERTCQRMRYISSQRGIGWKRIDRSLTMNNIIWMNHLATRMAAARTTHITCGSYIWGNGHSSHRDDDARDHDARIFAALPGITHVNIVHDSSCATAIFGIRARIYGVPLVEEFKWTNYDATTDVINSSNSRNSTTTSDELHRLNRAGVSIEWLGSPFMRCHTLHFNSSSIRLCTNLPPAMPGVTYQSLLPRPKPQHEPPSFPRHNTTAQQRYDYAQWCRENERVMQQPQQPQQPPVLPPLPSDGYFPHVTYLECCVSHTCDLSALSLVMPNITHLTIHALSIGDLIITVLKRLQTQQQQRDDGGSSSSHSGGSRESNGSPRVRVLGSLRHICFDLTQLTSRFSVPLDVIMDLIASPSTLPSIESFELRLLRVAPPTNIERLYHIVTRVIPSLKKLDLRTCGGIEPSSLATIHYAPYWVHLAPSSSSPLVPAPLPPCE